MTDITTIGPTVEAPPSEALAAGDETPSETDLALQHRLAALQARSGTKARVKESATPTIQPCTCGLQGSNVPAEPEPAGGRQRRRHPAMGARIFAVGLSTAAMFGIVAVMGVDTSPEPVVSASEQTTSPATSMVGTQSTSPVLVSADLPIQVPTKVTVTEVSNEPIQLTAEPVVRAAEPAPAEKAAPIAKTNGSR